jgi:hypothetical protein
LTPQRVAQALAYRPPAPVEDQPVVEVVRRSRFPALLGRRFARRD